ncbi:hypothetical protein GCM10007301_31110 [Azorhizobium oxalatiphilum]|uniref:Uncharacterized protein n=1 Tax=Azorhizobium oxalatiphilum TaxID=980631 RepID=A0A917C2K1_9HYPH|nr:hypothetical protein [Azorhizobium oxalatiphilum]GGF69198.1 hypothetical protein GCM10007301_31110 [Azorhizobium oxalatiphilum]
MTIKTTLLALGTAATLMAAVSSTAFAGPDVGPLNAEQYSVSAQGNLGPLTAPRATMKSMRPAQSGIGNLIGAADPHWGPSFDPDVE